MKKFYYLLLALPLMLFASCHDDDNDIPDVDLSVQFENATLANDTLYVVQGDTVLIADIQLINNTGKKGAVGNVNIYWDRFYVTPVFLPFSFETANQPVGRHLLGVEASVFVVDYPVCFGYMEYPVKIVKDESQIPTGTPDPTIGGHASISSKSRQ